MSNKSIDDRLDAYRKSFRLHGKIAVVLGAASGIGKASAEAMKALGASVISADHNRAGVEATAAELGGEAYVVDAGSSDDIYKLAASIVEKHQRLDIAVTTPAVHVRKLMCDYTNEAN